MFTIDEEALRRQDPTYDAVGDTKDLEPDVLHSLLNFIDSNAQDSSEIPEVDLDPDTKQGMSSETIDPATSSSDALSTVRDLNTTGMAIREQCKMMIDLSYEMDDVATGEEVLDDLCRLYRLFYKKCGGEDGVVGVRKDNQKFRTLAGKRRNKGFFRKRRIVPLFPTKNRKSRMQKVSRFGKKASHRENTTTDCSTCSTPTPSSPVHETDMDMSPFINLEAYRGQDQRQATRLGTPGLLGNGNSLHRAIFQVFLIQELLTHFHMSPSVFLFYPTVKKNNTGTLRGHI